MTDARRKLPKLLVKLAVTLSLCAVILWKADFAQLGATLQQVDPLLIALVVVMMLLSVPLSAYKWRQTLAIHDIQYRFADLHRWYYVAVFFNNFLPSSIGGDGYRLYKTLDNGVSRAGALIAVFVERLSGIVTLLMLGYGAAVLLYVRHADQLGHVVTWIGVACLAAGLLGLLIAGRARLLARLRDHPRLPQKLRTVLGRMDDFRARPGLTLWACGGVSIIFHLHTIAFYWLLIAALGGRADPAGLVVVLAVTAVAGVLPITVNGIGLVDGVFIYAARHYGLSYEVALSTMLMIRAINLLISMVGAWFYFTAGTSRQVIRDSLEATSVTEQKHATG